MRPALISQKSRDMAMPGEQANGLAITVGCLTTFACILAVGAGFSSARAIPVMPVLRLGEVLRAEIAKTCHYAIQIRDDDRGK